MNALPARVGLDLGGTKCLGVLLDTHGEVIREVRRPTPRGDDAVIGVLADVARELLESLGRDHRARASVGVGVPGLVTRDGVLTAAPNLPGVVDLDVAGRLGEVLGRGVSVDNDATCATSAEWALGAGRGSDDLVLVTLGTGIGGGAVSAGKILRGHHGFAGEFGHMVVDPAGPPCVCGRRGCWERYASGAGLARLARDAALGGRAVRVVELAGGDPESVRGEHVALAAREGDRDALAVIDEFGRWVAIGLVNLTNAYDPEVIVVGGGLVRGADLYGGPIDRWFDALLYASERRPRPRIVPADWDERAGAVGAALLGAA